MRIGTSWLMPKFPEGSVLLDCKKLGSNSAGINMLNNGRVTINVMQTK